MRAYPRSWSRDFPTSSRSWSSSSISQSRCPSDQQAGHVTHRPTFVSKYSSQGLSQQLSNLQIRRAFKDSCKIFSTTGYRVYRPVPAIQPCTLVSTTDYRVYRLYSLVHLLQQPVTEELMEETEFNTR